MMLKMKKMCAGVLALAMVFTSMGFGNTGKGLGFGAMEAMAAEWGNVQFPVKGEIRENSTITIGAYPNMPEDVSFTVKYDNEGDNEITGNTYTIPRGTAGKFMYIYAYYNNKTTRVAVLSNAVKVLGESATEKQIIQVLTDKQLCVGETVSAKVIPADATVTYEWVVNGNTVSTEKTYTIPSDASGKPIYARVTGTGEYVGLSLFSNDVAVVTPLIAVDIAGEKKVGNEVVANLNPTGGTVKYNWKIDGQVQNTDGAVNFTIPEGSSGKMLSVQAVGIGEYGKAVESATYSIIGDKTPITGVNISGISEQGSNLYAYVQPEGATVTYQWNSTDVKYTDLGTTNYCIIPSDLVGEIWVVVTGTGDYEGSVESAHVNISAKPVASVTITGKGEVGEVLTATCSNVGMFTNYEANWYSGTDVVKTEQLDYMSGRVSTYTAQASDVGKEVYCIYTGSNNGTATGEILQSNKITIGGVSGGGGHLTDSTEDVTEQDKDVNDMTTDWTGDVIVQVTQGQSFVVTIPAVITLDGSLDTPRTEFNVTVTANISGLDIITVEPTQTRITFKEAGGVKNDLFGDFNVAQTEYSVARCGQASLEAGHVENGFATVEKLSSGAWTAITGFRVGVRSN